MTSILDTTAFSAAMRNDPGIVALLGSGPPGQFAVVPPVVAEIEYGIQRLADGRRKALLDTQKERLLSAIPVLDWEPEASHLFGTIKADLEGAGTPIDDFDIAVAAIASAHGAEVITANLVHFGRILDVPSRSWR